MSVNKEAIEKFHEINTNFEELKKDLKEKHEKLASKEHVDALLLEKMDRINDAITKSETAISAAEEAQKMAKAMRHAAHAEDEDESDKVKKKFKSSAELKAAFTNFIRKGEQSISTRDNELLSLHTKTLSSSSDPAGGYVVLPEIDTQIQRILYETSPMRQVAEVKQISSDQLLRLVRIDLPAVGWADRPDSVDSLTSTPTFQQISIRVFKEWAEPAISQDLIDDAYIDIEAELTQSLAQAFEINENTAFVLGTGQGQPRGFLTYPAGSWNDATPNTPAWGTIQQVVSGNATGLTYAGIVNLVYKLKSGYLPRAVFMCNRLTVAQMRLIVDDQHRPLWEPGMGAEPATFMGYPIVRAADMPNVGAGALAIAFGDFSRGYLIVDRIGTRVLRDPFTSKPFVKFYTTKRVGGNVQNFEAIKLQVIST